MQQILSVDTIGDPLELRRMVAYLARVVGEQQRIIDCQQAVIYRLNEQHAAELAEASREHNYDHFHHAGSGGY